MSFLGLAIEDVKIFEEFLSEEGGKAEKEFTLDPLEEGFEHIGDALLVWQCSILSG